MTEEQGQKARTMATARELLAHLVEKGVPQQVAEAVYAAAVDPDACAESFVAHTVQALPGGEEFKSYFQLGRVGPGVNVPADGWAGAGSRVYPVRELMRRMQDRMDIQETWDESTAQLYVDEIGGGLLR